MATGSDHPYRGLPDDRYWGRAMRGWESGIYDGLYRPRFELDRKTPIATAGSCFAQHVGRALRTRGYNLLDLEPPPPLLAPERRAEFGFELFSCRYGNVYTSRQLLQLFRRSRGAFLAEEIWETDGRFFDPLRPSIEPGGFADKAEVAAAREAHLDAVSEMWTAADVLVFTFGLTESWTNVRTGVTYPVCPGTVAGTFDPEQHRFENLGYDAVLGDMVSLVEEVRAVNPELRFLFTVSPVPLVATATGDHVLLATIRSKSILRAVAAELRDSYPFVDYFPSYEIVAAPWARQPMYEADLRSVRSTAVEAVMGCFFAAHGDARDEVGDQDQQSARLDVEVDAEMEREYEVICDEESLAPDAD